MIQLSVMIFFISSLIVDRKIENRNYEYKITFSCGNGKRLFNF